MNCAGAASVQAAVDGGADESAAATGDSWVSQPELCSGCRSTAVLDHNYSAPLRAEYVASPCCSPLSS